MLLVDQEREHRGAGECENGQDRGHRSDGNDDGCRQQGQNHVSQLGDPESRRCLVSMKSSQTNREVLIDSNSPGNDTAELLSGRTESIAKAPRSEHFWALR